MKKDFAKILFILSALGVVVSAGPLLKPALAHDDNQKDDDIICIPNPFPDGWKLLHKDWEKLHLPECGKETPPPTPTPTPPPSGGGSTTNTSGGPTGGGPFAGPSCNDGQPSAPSLTGVSNLGGGKIKLTWTAVSPVGHYAIAYGLESGKYIYGATDVGNVTSYTVTLLDPVKNYCFVVSAVNGCASSGFSNEKCSGGQVLGASTGQVLGLSNTGDGGQTTRIVFAVFGLLCLMSGVYLRKQKAD